jgi:hypothetical protein
LPEGWFGEARDHVAMRRADLTESLGSNSQGDPSNAVGSDLQGYVALAASVGLLLMPASPPLTEDFRIASTVILFGVGLASGIGAVRRGGAAGRATGSLALILLALVTTALVIRGVMDWESVRRYWRWRMGRED